MVRRGTRSYSRPMYKAGPNWASLLGYLIITVIFGALIVGVVSVLDFLNNMLK